MKIAHVCLSCFYIDGFSYQENQLVSAHVAMGHDVHVFASTESIGPDGKLNYLEPSTYQGTDGAPVTRIAYASWLPAKLGRKLRVYPGTFNLIENFAPDVILFHGACAWELRTVAAYAARNPGTRFFIDSHEDWNNSARSFVSRELLHRRYYGPILRSVADKAEKILCLSTESMDFVKDLYRISVDKLEFYPLGGFPLEGEEYETLRQEKRSKLKIGDEILLVQSGKQTGRKKLLETLRAFASVPDPKLRLVIAGVLAEDIREEADTLIAADDRVQFLGWHSSDELNALLCAADVYVQPGTQSATMQHSLCNQCAVILDNCPAHQVYKADNGYFVSTADELASAIAALPNVDLSAKKARSLELAKRILDYRVLARRILPTI